MVAIKKYPFGKALAGSPPSFVIILILLVLTLAVRLVFAEGLFFSESLTIAEDSKSLYSFDSTSPDSEAGSIARGKEFLKELRTLPSESWPVNVVLGLLYMVFGVSDLISILPGLMASLFAGFLIYMLGVHMFDEATGLLAAFLWAILPLSVFLSINLLPILPLVAINLLAVTLFFQAARHRAWGGYLPAAVVTALGLVLDWTLFLPTAFFMALYGLKRWKIPDLRTIGIGLLVLAVFLLPDVGAATADLYGLNLLLFDNFLILPLFVISLVFAAGLKRDLPLNFLLLWLAVKAAFIFMAAPFILQRPLLQTIGFSGYWLDLVPPVMILISFQFTRRFDSLQIKRMLLSIASFATVGLIFLIPVSLLPAGLVTASRISVGAAFLCIFLYLAFWKKDRPLGNVLLLSALLTFFTLASPSIINNYVASYIYPVEDAREVKATLLSLDQDLVVFVGDDFVYERLLYSGGYQNPQSLNENNSAWVYLLNANRPSEVPEGAYVLVSSDYLDFVLGITPANWSLIQELRLSNQQGFFLYRVNAENPS